MTDEQFRFSSSFWDDKDWNRKRKLPKEVFYLDDKMYFKFLSKEEMKEFINMKIKEDPILKREYRIKKINKINNYDKDIKRHGTYLPTKSK